MFQYNKKRAIKLMTINALPIVSHKSDVHFKNIYKDLKILNSIKKLNMIKCHVNKYDDSRLYFICHIQTTLCIISIIQ